MSLIKNSIWNVSGYIIPTIVAIPALGFLARVLGTEQFGIFTLAMAIVGYASIFDAGLTRAVVREVSINRNLEKEKHKIISSATICVFFLSCFGSLLIYIFLPQIVNLLNVSANIIPEVRESLSILALSIPVFLLNQIWLAILEGEERFGVVNIQKSISNSLIAGLPALFVLYEKDLSSAMWGLLAGRIVSMLLSFVISRKDIIQAGLAFDRITFKRLISFGGWITVSNIISPLMSYMDRFIVSNILGANSIAFYTVPAEAITRISLIPGALGRAIFPKLSSANNKEDLLRQQLFGYKLLAVACIPIAIIGAFFSESILTLWMGPDYSGTPAMVLRILLLGFLFNAFAQIPFANIQAIGKAKITAMLHLIELVPYLTVLYFLVHHMGIIGVAVAWTARVAVDYIVLYYINMKLTRHY